MTHIRMLLACKGILGEEEYELLSKHLRFVELVRCCVEHAFIEHIDDEHTDTLREGLIQLRLHGSLS